jgi:hypothetical protein
LLILLIILLFVQPEKKFAYTFVKGECDNKAAWIYQRIFENQERIVIAFTGASQTSCAIMDELVEKQLDSTLNSDLKVVSLGYCRRGRDIQFAMLKDLFSQKRPKILVIEITENEPAKSHPVFPYLAESKDVLGSLVFFNQRFLSNIYKALVVRFEYCKQLAFGNKTEKPCTNSNFGYIPSNQIVTIEELSRNKETWKKKLTNPKPALISKIENKYPLHYLEKMVKLAKMNHCDVVFLYLPEYGSGLKEPENIGIYRNIAPVILLPDSIIQNKTNWKDPMHFNDSGAKQASDFIVGELASQMKKLNETSLKQRNNQHSLDSHITSGRH